MLILPQQVMQQYQQSLKQQQLQQQSPGLLSPTQPSHLASPPPPAPTTRKMFSPTHKIGGGGGGAVDGGQEDDKFELTDDYIQQTIKEALESGNLTPDVQEKLMNQLSDESVKPKVKPAGGAGRKSKKKSAAADAFDPLTGERMDDEWEPQSYSAKAKINNQIREMKENKEKKQAAIASLNESNTAHTTTITTQHPNNYSPPQVIIKGPKHPQPPQNLQQPVPAPQPNSITTITTTPDMGGGGSRKFTAYTPSRLGSMLFKHKEQLKKDIARKRSVLEKNLMHEIQRDIGSLKKQAAIVMNQQNQKQQQNNDVGSNNSTTNAESQQPLPQSKENNAAVGRKRKAADQNIVGGAGNKKHAGANNHHHKKKLKTGLVENNKKERLYCICKTRYDQTKFYVGCDICSNWFHGSCVGITPKMSKTLKEYVCDECTQAKTGTETYCMCKQPYDETRFYIGCESCPDWLHGRCVGILQSEADGIQDYECPKCNPKYPMNTANLKKLKGHDLDIIKKLFKQILASKFSGAFKKPFNKRSNQKFYDLVKEPMDLETMEKKLNRDEYKTLAEFLADFTRITENCRYFFPPDSPNSKNAEQLELFVLDKLASIRQKLAAKR
eukprot:TRINITY_DN2718_c0_g1_i1.p1 TRINITY_DN2718_c0_g1~~TRINITY_DN2718_c0_g1_i1.p1  ORF type:complete len:657 (+),score=207.13 TRINITY_DN2718_c0_g1_i1:140-1972(+)